MCHNNTLLNENTKICRICYYDDINNKIVAIGGMNGAQDSRPKFDDSYKIDLSGNVPYIVESDTIYYNNGFSGIAVKGQTVAKMDNIIYFVFGLESDTSHVRSRTITTYDFGNNIWNTIETDGAITSVWDTCVLGLKNYKGINNALMAIGGNPLTSNIYYLDVNVGTWILDDGNLPQSRKLHSCVLIDETIYVIGGSYNNIVYGKPGTAFQVMLNSSNQELRTLKYDKQTSIYIRDNVNQTDLIYIIGGNIAMSSDVVEVIDVNRREQLALYPMSLSKATQDHCLVSNGIRLFVIGGLRPVIGTTYNEIEYTNSFMIPPTPNPTLQTSLSSQSPTVITHMPSQYPSTDPTPFPTIPTTLPSESPTFPPSHTPTVTTNVPSQYPTLTPTVFPTISTSLPSESPTFSEPTSTPSQSPSLSCNTIKITTLSKIQNDIPSEPICTSTIPCEWELSYKLQDSLINNRPQFISLINDCVISYTANLWVINFGVSKQLSVESSKSFPPSNEYWQLSTNNNIRFQLKIECATTSAINNNILPNNDIKVATIAKLLNQTNITPICSTSIPCNWELSYKLQETLTNDRPVYKSTINDVIIQYNFDCWEINLDTSTKLSVKSQSQYPPNNSLWQLSTNYHIEYQLRIESINVIDSSSQSGKSVIPWIICISIGIPLILIVIFIWIIYRYKNNKNGHITNKSETANMIPERQNMNIEPNTQTFADEGDGMS